MAAPPHCRSWLATALQLALFAPAVAVQHDAFRRFLHRVPPLPPPTMDNEFDAARVLCVEPKLKQYAPWCTNWLGCLGVPQNGENNSLCVPEPFGVRARNEPLTEPCAKTVLERWNPTPAATICQFHQEAANDPPEMGGATPKIEALDQALAGKDFGSCVAEVTESQRALSECVAQIGIYRWDEQRERDEKPLAYNDRVGRCYLGLHAWHQAMDPVAVTAKYYAQTSGCALNTR